MIEANRIIKGIKFWETELTKAQVIKRLPFFNDIVTGDTAPSNNNAEIMLKDVLLDGRKVDVYHYKRTSQLYLYLK